ncbi:MAG: ABC transporter permease [Acidilobaceae archaeon]|nr:ABC transporter permease [Acidilobaceae archaeon]MCX8165763.1 ABC transporter permease [Acidilobaceae archaeon]MDW7974188.1 ABC transporter permease [Sulfolobales archaeon]
MLGETYVLWYREMKKWLGRKPVLFISLFSPIFWILLFGKSFNPINLLPQDADEIVALLRAKIVELFGTQDYFTYVAAGMTVAFALFQASFAGASALFDRRLGYMDRLLVTPINRESIFAAKVLASVTRVVVLTAFLMAVSYIAGLQLKADITPPDLLLALLTVAFISLILSSIFMLAGFVMDNPEGLFAIGNLVNTPLLFASSVLFPTAQMPTWLRLIAEVNPLSHGADLVRYFLVGKPMEDPYLVLALFGIISVIVFLTSAKVAVKLMEK